MDLRQGNRVLSFQARVVQVFRSGSSGHGTAFQVPDPSELDETRLVEDRPTQDPEAGKELGKDLGETLGSSPIFRIQKLNTSEKMRLATRAGHAERKILLRDPSPQVHMGLLSNPHVEDSEVLELVRSRRTVGSILQRIAKDPKWSGNYEIRLAVVRHPQTPTPLAVDLLRRLNKRDLGSVARSSSMREAVKGPALRLYLKQM